MLQFCLLQRLHECRQGLPLLLHQPTSFHLQTAVLDCELLEKSGSDEWPHWGCGWETYICLASLRPWKRVRGMGDFLLFFSLWFHVQMSVSHLWCIVRSALTTVTCGVNTELLTGIPVSCRSRSIGIQQWWCVLMGTSFLVFIFFIVDIN